MVLNIDNCIQTAAGLSLSFLSVSGIMCVSKCPRSQACSQENNDNNNQLNLGCSRINMQLGLGAMGVTGGLLVYRGLRM